MTEKKRDFARYLAQLIVQFQLASIAELAALIDVEQGTLGRWLRGVGEPTIQNLRRMAPRIGVPVTELMVEAGLLTEAEVGSKPTPPKPINPRLQKIQDILDHPDVDAPFKRLLELAVDQSRVLWLEMYATAVEEPAPYRSRGRAIGRAASVDQLRGSSGRR